VLWRDNIGSGHAGEQVPREGHAAREAEYYKTTGTVQSQREQHWVESDDEELIQIQESTRAGEDKELAYAKVKAGVGSSAAVRLLRLLTLGSPAMLILICLVARAKALVPISSGANLLLQQNGWSSYEGVAQIPAYVPARKD